MFWKLFSIFAVTTALGIPAYAKDDFVVQKPLEPFFLFKEIFNSYQAVGWMKARSLGGCKMVEGEGNSLQEECLTLHDIVNVRQKPNDHRVIGSLSKGVPVTR